MARADARQRQEHRALIYRFGDCELDTERFELRRAGVVRRIEPQVFELLRYLVESDGRFVSKDDLIAAIWGGRIVSDAALASRIKAARQAVGDSGAEQRCIRTLHGRGFRFVAPVTREPPEGGRTDAAAADSLAEQVSQEIRYCVTGDGVRLAYATSGAGQPVVHALNWLTHCELDWQSPLRWPYFEELCRRHRLVRFDGRGNGLSDWEVADISFEAMVADLETVADAAGLERFAIFAKSQGCAVAIAYAARHPQRVSAMVLLGGYAQGWRTRGDLDEIRRREALMALIEVGWGTNHPAYHQMFASLYFPDGAAGHVASYVELQRLSTSPANAARLYDAFSKIDVAALLDRVRAPTLVMHARGDAVVPFEAGRRLAAAIPGARFAPLDSRNHTIVESEPAWRRLVQELRTFLPS